MATKRQDTQWKRLYTYIYYLFYVTYYTCKYAYTYTYSPLSTSSWQRAQRINDAKDLVPASLHKVLHKELHKVSPRVQPYIISLYDYVIKTVSLSTISAQEEWWQLDTEAWLEGVEVGFWLETKA